MVKSQSFNPNRVKSLKIKCLLSPLSIQPLKITLRSNSKPIFLYRIMFLKISRRIGRFQGKKHMEPKTFSLEHIENKMVPLNSEYLSSEDYFENKLQAKFDKPG